MFIQKHFIKALFIFVFLLIYQCFPAYAGDGLIGSVTSSASVSHSFDTMIIALLTVFLLIFIGLYVKNIRQLDQLIKEKVESQEKVLESQHLESLGIMAGGIAHDFNNLLSVIMGNVCLAKKHMVSHKTMPIYLSRIQQASTSAAAICRQMLAYAGKGNFDTGKVNLSEAVRVMTKLMEVSLFKHVEIQYDLAEDLPNTEGDVAQIKQVIMNLIINANEAIDREEGVIVVRTGIITVDADTSSLININIQGEHTYVYIEVSDNGCGMNEATIKNIFKPFFTTKQTGCGLGMSAMLGIVRGHKGIIQLDSQEGKGSTFRVAFPVICNNENQDDNMKKEYDALCKLQSSSRMLLVDDEEVVLETMQAMLEDLGCKSLLASNGFEAIEVYKKNHECIDLVLMDMTMPKMSGKACVEALKEINPEVKVILSSGYTEEDVGQQFSDGTLVGFLQKPCCIEDLQKTLENAL